MKKKKKTNIISAEACSECGFSDWFLGAWPFCHGNPKDHETTRSRWAQDFEPIVIFRNAAGKVRVPGKSDVATPAGYERIELRTRREIDAFTREQGIRESLRAERSRIMDEYIYERDLGRNRAEVQKLREGASPKARAFIDLTVREMDRRDAARKRYNPGIYFEVMENWKGNLE